MSDLDTLRRFLFEKEEIRGSIVRLGSTWQQLQATDDYPESIRNLLGEAAAATALLGRNLKFDGRLTLQVQGGEHLRLLVMQSDNQLRLRGLARFGDQDDRQQSQPGADGEEHQRCHGAGFQALSAQVAPAPQGVVAMTSSRKVQRQ